MTKIPEEKSSVLPGADPLQTEADTLLFSQGVTEDLLEDLLKQSRLLTPDPVEQEQQCLDLVNRMKNLDTVRELARQSLETATADSLPRSLGQFELLEAIGGGGMGQVFRARHLRLGKIQAVKVLHARRLLDSEAVARFQQEMRAIGQLQHPHIVSAQHADEADGVPYLVMDYVEGRSLSQLVQEYRKRNHQIPVALACELVRQAAEGLQYAHGCGVIHRDVKPGNIMLDRRGTVRVLDLGLARSILPGASSAAEPDLTTEHQILGTPDYMAPEQIRSSRAVDARADVYALGATLYYLLTQQVVFPVDKDASVFERVVKVLNAPVPNLSLLRSDVPPELAKLVERCLMKDPDQRMASAGQLAAELTQWASAEALVSVASGSLPVTSLSAATDQPDGQAPTRALPAPGPAGPPSRRWLKLACAGLLPVFLLLLAGLVYRLKLPDGGELVVTCDDPAAQITVTAVQDQIVAPLQFTQDAQGTLKLNEGRWEIRIAGLQAEQFQISQNEIVVSRGEKVQLRVTRRSPQQMAESGVRVNAPENGSMTPAETNMKQVNNIAATSAAPSANSNSPGHQPQPSSIADISDAEILKRLAAREWQAGAAAELPGYASFPAALMKAAFDWQILPVFATNGFHLEMSPQGTWVAAWHDRIYDPYIRILNRKTGRLAGLLYFPGRYDRKLDWSPDETRFVLSRWDWNELTAAVCRIDGTVLAQWTQPEQQTSTPIPFWNPDGSRIAFVSSEMIQQTTPEGLPIADYAILPHGSSMARNMVHRPHSFWSPDGSQFAVGVDGELRVYQRDGGTPLAVLRAEPELTLDDCIWHPNGVQILTGGVAKPNEHGAARLWTLSGEFVDYGFSKLHETAESFSPDGQFFVTNWGMVRSLAGDQLSESDVSLFGDINVGAMISKWTKDDRIIQMSVGRGPGFCREVSPTGRVLAEYQHPAPVPQKAVSWSTTHDHFESISGIYGSAASRHFRWTPEGGAELSDRYPVCMDGVVAFAPDGQKYAATRNNMAASVFDSDHRLLYETASVHSHRLCSWSAASDLLATATPDMAEPRVEVWRNEQRVATLTAHQHEILGLQWSVQEDLLCVWDAGLNVFVWDISQPDAPILKRMGDGFRLGLNNNHWFFNTACPRWSPDGKWLAIPQEKGVLLVSPRDANDKRIEFPDDLPAAESTAAVMWWSPDGESLIVGDTIYAKNGEPLGRLEVGRRSVPFLNWLDKGRLVTAWHRGVAIHETLQAAPTVLTLPGFDHNAVPDVSLLSRGANARRVSPSERYFVHQCGVAATNPNSHGGGDVHLIDLQEKRHLWTGLAFTDGAQVRLQPNGKAQLPTEDFDRYLTYVIRYPTGRLIPLTQLQFASRIDLSEQQAFLQQVLDLNGRILLSNSVRHQSVDPLDARYLPAERDIVGLDLSGNTNINDQTLQSLSQLPSLKKLSLHQTAVTGEGLAGLSQLTQLEYLKLAGLPVDDRLVKRFPASLIDLDLSNTLVTNLTVWDLKSFVALQRLNLSGAPVSEEAVAALRKALPECQITFGQSSHTSN